MKKFITVLLIVFICNPFGFVFAEEIPIEEPIEDPVEVLVEEPEISIEEPVGEPIEIPEEPAEEPIVEEIIEEPTEVPIEEPVVDLIEEPVDEPVEEEIVYIYFSEIAWMGTGASSNDEWIELYNSNTFPVELDGWIIRNDDISFEVMLSGTIAPESYFILERTDDTTVDSVEADQIYTGALGNDGEYLQLIDPLDFIVDEVDMWHAGDNETKITMSRANFILSGTDILAWCNSSQVHGSPNEENICEVLPEVPIDVPIEESIVNNIPIPIIGIQGDSNYMHVNVTGGDSYDPDGDSLTYFWDYGDGNTSNEENPKSYYYQSAGEKIISLTVVDELGLSAIITEIFTAKEKAVSGGSSSSSSPSVSEPVVILKSYSKGAVVFDSALPNPNGRDSGLELIKLKNTLNNNIDLLGWKIIDAKGGQKIFDSFVLPSKTTIQTNQDVFKVTLNNDNEELFLYDPSDNLIDQISWNDAPSGVWVPNLSFLYDGIQGVVLNVVDGDTFKISFNDIEMKVRLIGVDTPETVHPNKEVEQFGYEASDFLKKMINEKSVILKFDEDKADVYGRLLAYVYIDGLFVNAEIIKQGIGYAYTRYPFKYLDDFMRYEAEALLNLSGIWITENAELIEELVSGEDEDFDDVLEIDPEGAVPAPRLQGGVNCNSDFLKIDSILPNPQKGEAIEYIRLVNTGSETICLNGWVLDDVVGGGSKSFIINDGAIAPGAMRSFRKDETRLALNNSNDCATLINSNGEIADQICYGKTHKNEVFNHEGGDWQPKPKKTKTTSVGSSKRQTFDRESIAYIHEFSNEKVVGNIDFIYEDGELVYLTLDDNSIIQVSYASSPVDIGMAKQLLDISESVEINYRKSADGNELISISQAFPEGATSTSRLRGNNSRNDFRLQGFLFLKIILILGSIICLLMVIKKRYIHN